jgi:hypothetical protein
MALMTGTTSEDAAREPNAGAIPPPAARAGLRTHQRQRPGPYAMDRPPILRVGSRQSAEPRFGVCDHAEKRPSPAIPNENSPAGSMILDTDAWPRAHDGHPAHATLCHSAYEGEDIRERHGHTCEGAGAGLRTSGRVLRGVYEADLPLDVATDETLINPIGVMPAPGHHLCFGDLSMHVNDI